MGVIATKNMVRVQIKDSTSTWNTVSDGSTGFVMPRHRDKVGVLQINFWDVNNVGLDPSKNPSGTHKVIKGQKIRVQSSSNGSTWVDEYNGTVRKVDVDPKSLRGTKRLIQVTAGNGIQDLVAGGAGIGAGSTDDLRYTLTQAGTGISFNVNGTTSAKASPTADTFPSDNNDDWELTLITKDSQDLYVWMDKSEVLQVQDGAHKSTSLVATFTTSDYSDVDLNYTIEDTINDASGWSRKKGANGKVKTVFVYRKQDGTSITQNGRYKAKYVYHGLSDSQIQTKIDNIVATNKTPSVVPTGCTVPILNTSDVTTFVQGIDLNDKCSITDPDGNTYTVRVVSIKHTVTESTWNVEFGFINPTLIPRARVIKSTGVANVTDKQVETAQINDLAVDTLQINALAVTTPKLADGAVTAAKASATLLTDIGGNKVSAGTVAPTSPVTGDIWIDTGNGNILKRWSGSSWSSVQDAAIATAQATANGKNTVTYSSSTPGATANTAGDIWFQTSSGVVVGQWQGNGGTSWSSVTLGNLVIAALDAGKITTGTLSAARIATSSIDTTKLIISNVSNIVDDPGFELGSASWIGSGTIATIADPAVGGTKVYQIASNGTALAVNYQPSANGVVVNPGETYYFEIKVRKTTTGTTGSLQFVAGFTKDGTSGTTLTVGGSTVTMASLTQNVWTTVSGQLTVPAGKNYMKAQAFVNSNVPSGQTIQWDDAVIRKAGDANLIVDGSITAGKLAAGSIDGMTITGAVLQTASSGNRLKLYGTGTEGRIEHYAGISGENPGIIKAANSSGVPVFTINSGTTASFPNAAGIQLSATTVAPNGAIVLTGDVTVNNSISVGTLSSGSPINGLTHGSFSGSTNASSQVTVSHGLTSTPTRVFVTSTGQNGQMKRVLSRNSTSFVVEHRGTSGSLVGNGVAVAFDWLAIM